MTADLIAVVGSITTASRLEKKISATGRIFSRIVHTPAELGNGGCSYSIRTKGENLPVVIETANRYRIKVKGYYLIESSNGKEVYHALS